MHVGVFLDSERREKSNGTRSEHACTYTRQLVKNEFMNGTGQSGRYYSLPFLLFLIVLRCVSMDIFTIILSIHKLSK